MPRCPSKFLRRAHVATLGALLAVVMVGEAAEAGWNTGTTKDGVHIDGLLSQSQLRNLSMGYTLDGAPDPIKYEYVSAIGCPGVTPDSPNRDVYCAIAFLACADNPPEEGLGPLVTLYRRQVDPAPNPSPAPWQRVGTTCFPELVPGEATLGMAQILAAFHDTKFALPQLVIQPKGNLTLVNLATFYQLTWPQTGYQPGEVDAVDPGRMLGFRVEIRPSLKSITYHFGDGTTFGPTTSTGGPYPSGDVVKTYRQAGTFEVYAQAVYTGQFRVGGGPWLDIPGDVTIAGAPVPQTVKTATARLYGS